MSAVHEKAPSAFRNAEVLGSHALSVKLISVLVSIPANKTIANWSLLSVLILITATSPAERVDWAKTELVRFVSKLKMSNEKTR